MARVLSANADYRVPYFHRPRHQPDYRRTFNALATAPTVGGGLLVANDGPHSEWSARVIIVAVVFVLVCGAPLQ